MRSQFFLEERMRSSLYGESVGGTQFYHIGTPSERIGGTNCQDVRSRSTVYSLSHPTSSPVFLDPDPHQQAFLQFLEGFGLLLGLEICQVFRQVLGCLQVKSFFVQGFLHVGDM